MEIYYIGYRRSITYGRSGRKNLLKMSALELLRRQMAREGADKTMQEWIQNSREFDGLEILDDGIAYSDSEGDDEIPTDHDDIPSDHDEEEPEKSGEDDAPEDPLRQPPLAVILALPPLEADEATKQWVRKNEKYSESAGTRRTTLTIQQKDDLCKLHIAGYHFDVVQQRAAMLHPRFFLQAPAQLAGWIRNYKKSRDSPRTLFFEETRGRRSNININYFF